MNKIAAAKSKEVLDYLKNGLKNAVDTITSRYYQQQGLEVFRDTDKMFTGNIEAMQNCASRNIYENSSSGGNRFDEFARVSLTSVERK